MSMGNKKLNKYTKTKKECIIKVITKIVDKYKFFE